LAENVFPGLPQSAQRPAARELPGIGAAPFVIVAHEHIYWDQASVLVQVGLLDRALPVRGGEIAAQVLNPTQLMNELIRRALNKNKEADNAVTAVR
jgi:carboxymethylenebutenolidase